MLVPRIDKQSRFVHTTTFITMFVLVQFGDTGQAARLFNSNVTRDSFLAFVHRSALREAAQYAKAVEHTEARCAASAQDQVNALEAAAAAMAEGTL